ncbi:hypothetical protein WOLCODRAFT_33044, partial [Wolfiporia cocos MD-104 SS10]
LSAILPIPIYLQRLNDTTAIRLRTLPTQSQPLQRLNQPQKQPYPLSKCTIQKHMPYTTPLLYLNSLLPKHTDHTYPFEQTPWHPMTKWGSRLQWDLLGTNASKDTKKAHLTHIRSIIDLSTTSSSTICVYTDGSTRPLLPHRFFSGASYLITHLETNIHQRLYGLGRTVTTYDAETFALSAASHYLTHILTNHPDTTTIHYFTDNTTAL